MRNLAGDSCLHIVDEQGGIVGRADLLQRSRYRETLNLQHSVLLRCSDCGGESGCWVAFADEICDSSVGAGQSFLVRQEDDAKMLRAGLLSEAGAVDDHHVFLADEFFDEGFIALRNIDAGKGVKPPA